MLWAPPSNARSQKHQIAWTLGRCCPLVRFKFSLYIRWVSHDTGFCRLSHILYRPITHFLLMLYQGQDVCIRLVHRTSSNLNPHRCVYVFESHDPKSYPQTAVLYEVHIPSSFWLVFRGRNLWALHWEIDGFNFHDCNYWTMWSIQRSGPFDPLKIYAPLRIDCFQFQEYQITLCRLFRTECNQQVREVPKALQKFCWSALPKRGSDVRRDCCNSMFVYTALRSDLGYFWTWLIQTLFL